MAEKSDPKAPKYMRQITSSPDPSTIIQQAFLLPRNAYLQVTFENELRKNKDMSADEVFKLALSCKAIPCNYRVGNKEFAGYTETRNGQVYRRRFYDNDGKLEKEVTRFPDSKITETKIHFDKFGLMVSKFVNYPTLNENGKPYKKSQEYFWPNSTAVKERRTYFENGQRKQIEMLDRQGKLNTDVKNGFCLQSWDAQGTPVSMRYRDPVSGLIKDLVHEKKLRECVANGSHLTKKKASTTIIPFNQTHYYKDRQDVLAPGG